MRALGALIILATALAANGFELDVLFTPKSTPFRGPRAMQAGLLEVLYVADTGHHRLVALDSTGRIIHESSQGGSTGELRWPEDVAIGAAGRVFVADAGNRRVVEYTRLLEWKGELVVSTDGETELEPRKLSANGAGDLFVFESDNGQILRYDPFYALASRMGARSGNRELRPVVAMDYSNTYGLIWIEQNGSDILRSDRFLTSVTQLPLAPMTRRPLQVTALDSCLFVCDSDSVWRVRGGVQESASCSELFGTDIRIGDLIIEAVSPTRLYALDRRTGALYRLLWP